MAFWGVEVKPGKPFTLKVTETKGMQRLHLSQATLGLGNATTRCSLQCNVGTKSPVFLCALYPGKVDSCQLNMEFEEAHDVFFSVIGPRSVHLTGYFLGRSNSLLPNDDESESFGEDIAGSDMEKASSDDYDYSDSFINDGDPCGRVSSTDDDELSIKELAAKTKDKKKNGKGRRLRKKFQVPDSESDETSARLDDSSNGDSMKVLSSEVPLPSRNTRSKATSSSCEIGEPNAKLETTSEGTTLKDKSEDKPLGDVKLSKKKRNKEPVVIIHLDDDGEGKHILKGLENEKPAAHKETKSSSEVLPSENGDATSSKKKKKRKRDRREETTDAEKSLSESPERKKQAINKNIKAEADTKKPLESEITSNEVIIEEIEKGKLDGKLAVKGKKVSIHYTAKLKDTGKLFASSLGEDAPLRFRLDGKKVIKGLSIGVEGMRVGDKRRLIIPPSLGYSEEGLIDAVPKNAWLVYEVEAVKV